MIGFLRFVGVVNAAIWFGAAIFFTFAAGPAFFSPEMKQLLPPPYNGAAAQIVIARYFIFQYICGAIALIHLLAEWLYMGRPLERLTLLLLSIIFCFGLFGGIVLQPKLKKLHLIKYSARSTPVEKEAAEKSFATWHGISQVANLFVTTGLFFYLWRATRPALSSRLPGMRKLTVGWK